MKQQVQIWYFLKVFFFLNPSIVYRNFQNKNIPQFSNLTKSFSHHAGETPDKDQFFKFHKNNSNEKLFFPVRKAGFTNITKTKFPLGWGSSYHVTLTHIRIKANQLDLGCNVDKW